MKEYRLKAELWEIQVLLMWILSLGLYETGHSVLFWFPLVWGIITFIGIFVVLVKGAVETVIEERNGSHQALK